MLVHLKGCPTCLEEYESLRAQSGRTRSTDPASAGAGQARGQRERAARAAARASSSATLRFRVAARLQVSRNGLTASIHADLRRSGVRLLKCGGSAAELVQRCHFSTQPEERVWTAGAASVSAAAGGKDLGGRVDEVAAEVVELVVRVPSRKRERATGSSHGASRLSWLACARHRVQPDKAAERRPKMAGGERCDAVRTVTHPGAFDGVSRAPALGKSRRANGCPPGTGTTRRALFCVSACSTASSPSRASAVRSSRSGWAFRTIGRLR